MAYKNNKIIISSSTKNLSAVRSFVEKKAIEANIKNDITYEIMLAVDEACTNIIKHSHKYDSNKKIEIEIQNSGKQFKIVLKYVGIAFDPNNIENPNMNDYFQNYKVGGLGIPIIKKFMNKIEFAHKKPNYNSLTLIRSI